MWMEFHSGRVVNPWVRNAVYLARKGNEEYEFDPEEDASKPAEFERDWDRGPR